MHQSYLDFSEAVVRWTPPVSLLQMIGDLLRKVQVWEEGFLITIILTSSSDTSNMWFPTNSGGKAI